MDTKDQNHTQPPEPSEAELAETIVNQAEESIAEDDEMPDNTSDETSVEEQSELATALTMVEEFKNALQRERADFTNYRKRVEREKTEQKATTTAELLLQFLPIIDDFERAMSVVPEEMSQNDWMKGFVLIHKKFNDLLNNLGIEEINPVGERFDPNFHEAIGSDESDEVESDHVTVVLQKGYQLDGKCIRPAMVKVAN